jgi:hypothetical protein
MRRGVVIGLVLLMIVAGVAIGVSAYNWGLAEGLERTAEGAEVVRVVDGRGWGFPFGLILFPLFFFGIFALMRGLFWSRRWGDHGGHGWGPGRWQDENHPARAKFDDWHRRQHEAEGGDRPATTV